jgi:SAM-dependent methyltransferase
MSSIWQDIRHNGVRGAAALAGNRPADRARRLKEMFFFVFLRALVPSWSPATLFAPLTVVLSALCMPGIAAQPPPAKGPDIHFVATPQPVADAMLKLARVTAGDVVYDLGSGDGRIVILAAQKYGARGVGVEIDPRLVEISRQVAREGEVDDRVTFIQGDLFAADLSKATVVTLWLSETVNARLEEKLKRELPPGARVVSRQFPIGKWMPHTQIVAEGDDIFLWTIKN